MTSEKLALEGQLRQALAMTSYLEAEVENLNKERRTLNEELVVGAG